MFKSIAFKTWLPFAVVLVALAIVFNVYYPSRQEEIFLESKRNELSEVVRTVQLGVELSISNGNYAGLRKTVQFASSRGDFEFIAIVQSIEGAEEVIAVYPDTTSRDIVLNRDLERLIYEEAEFDASTDFSGKVLIAASLKNIERELSDLNRPITYGTVGILFVSLIVYLGIARGTTRRLVSLAQKAGALSIRHDEIGKTKESGDELSRLEIVLNKLQESLNYERDKNLEFNRALESQVAERTSDLKRLASDLEAAQVRALTGSFRFPLNGSIGEVSEMLYKLLLLEKQDLVLSGFVNVLTKLSGSQRFDELLTLPSKETFYYEFQIESSAESKRWLVISVENILNELSGIRELVGYIQDVTRRKEAELELNRLSLVATKTTNCVIITDKNRKITWANSSTTALTGYTFEEMVGKSPSMFQCEGTNPQTVKYIREKLSSNENIKCEILNRSKFGREYWLELNIVPLFDDDNEVYGYIAVETDITQIKETSMELAEREMQLRNILDNASEMIHTLDANGNVLWANKSWMRNLEVDEQKLSEINLLNLLDDATKEEFMQVMPALKNGKSVEDLNCGFFSISGKHLNLRGITIPLFEAGVFIGSQAYLHNVTEIVRAESELRRISSLQEVIMSYSNQFISSSWAESFEIVSGSLGALGRILGVSRICLESLSQREIAFNTSWKEKGDDSLQLLGLLPENVREEFFNELKDKGFIQLNMNDIAGFIPEVVRRDFGSIWMFGLLNSQGISSILSLGLPENINLNDSEIELIRLYCQMIVNLENRFRFLQQVESAKKEIEAINTSLESKVLENTKRNLELSKLVVEHEKLATIGEFSAGIAHDLNTPLGAIKSGSESLRYSLKALSDKLRELNIEQFELILDLAKAIGKSSYLSGMQFAREVKSARQYLTDHFTDRYAKVSGIEEMLVRCRIPLTDHVTVERILRFENPVLFLEALDHAQNIYSLLEILDVSVERAGSVVKTMRSFVKKDTSEKSNLKWIRLHENISVVLNIFSFELRRNVETVFECPQNIRIEGFDVKLFQLWSNLIKNALEAMDGMENKRLEIRAHSENGRVYVEVANNGPVIPEEARIQIFKKFYSTKKHKSGTGLGLSIVQNIAEEHGATIRLESSEERTSFILTFSKVKED